MCGDSHGNKTEHTTKVDQAKGKVKQAVLT
jgi:hypothetical protein